MLIHIHLVYKKRIMNFIVLLLMTRIVKIIEAGCFVEVWSGCEGFVHISKLAKDRVNKVEDVVKEGDEIVVKYIGTDNKGRLNFSRKDAM